MFRVKSKNYFTPSAGTKCSLTNTGRQDHISPVLASLHWLPVSFRTDVKILLIIFKACHGLAPSYIAELLLPCEPERSLSSSDTGLLAVPNGVFTPNAKLIIGSERLHTKSNQRR